MIAPPRPLPRVSIDTHHTVTIELTAEMLQEVVDSLRKKQERYAAYRDGRIIRVEKEDEHFRETIGDGNVKVCFRLPHEYNEAL